MDKHTPEPGLGEMTPSERAEIIALIIRDVCELPDRTSLPDRPDELIVTIDELAVILDRRLAGAPPRVQRPPHDL